MKILQLGKFYPIQGGVEKVMYDLMTGLGSKYPELECDMLCVAATPQPEETKILPNATLYCTKLDKKLFSTMLSSSLIKKLKRICKKYDIIHIHHPDPMVALALWLSNYKGKVVLHWHSDILKQKTLLKLYRPLQNWLIKRSDIIIGTTPKYLEESPHLKPFENKKKIAVPIGILPVKYDEKTVGKIKNLYENKKIVFSLGRLVGYKGFEYMIKAANYLPHDYIILIGGSGPLKDELKSLIDSNNLNGKVKLLGRVEDNELPAYYGACDIFVLSSIWKTEAFGIVQIEAMSCGKPVVATNIPESGVDWVNKDGFSGINVKPEDSKELAKAILDVTKSNETYERFSSQARERFNQLFTLDGMVEKCYNIYSEINKEL